MIRKLISVLALAPLAAICTSEFGCNAQALTTNLIVNGSFELPSSGSTSYFTPQTWLTTGSLNDRPALCNGVNWPGHPAPPEDGQQCIVIGTEGDGTHDNVFQSFTVTNGGNFLLSWFDQTPPDFGPQQSIYSVTVSNSSNAIVATTNLNAYHATPGWQSESMQCVLAIGTYTLMFEGEVAPGGVGSMLDNVSLVQVPGPPIITIQKAVYLTFTNLLVGLNYQVQASSDLINWTNQGSVFTATNSNWQATNYWNVNDWNKLFFLLQVVP